MRMFCNNRDCKEARMYETLKHIDEFILRTTQIRQEIKKQQTQLQLAADNLLDYGTDDPIPAQICQIIDDHFQVLLTTLESK